jgi:DNA-directed RNA polymerase specialized sigma24 family protein
MSYVLSPATGGVGPLGTMATVNPAVDQTPASADPIDPESAEWLGALASKGERREAALARLHEMLLRIVHRECRRRGPRLRITGPELDDLAYQAAADALVAITRKLGQFRGESRFTTWAYKFVILEVSDKIGTPVGRANRRDGPRICARQVKKSSLDRGDSPDWAMRVRDRHDRVLACAGCGTATASISGVRDRR